VWMAATLGVAKSTLQLWEKDIPEFSAAMTQARALSQLWWEDAGQANMLLAPGVGTFNASVWSRSMAARFPEDWRENKGVELSGSVAVARELSDDDLKRIAAGSSG
jgi:hypothetical protein